MTSPACARLVPPAARVLVAAAALAGCVTHAGPDRLEPGVPGWDVRADGVCVARSARARVAAFHDSAGERCVFGGSVTNRTPDPLRVTIRPAEFDVPDDTVVGLDTTRGFAEAVPIRCGDVLVVPPAGTPESEGGPAGAAAGSNVLRFSLRPTSGPAGVPDDPRPYSAGDVVTRTTTSSGISISTPARPARTGDVARYTITLSGPGDDESWSHDFRTVPGPDVVDVPWTSWLALPLLPLYAVLNWCGAVD